MVDAIRTTGNFAAHPTKSTASGEIIDVEPGEAELSIEVLEMLFDHWYLLPAEVHVRIGAINEKLTMAGKPIIRLPPRT
jgi:hypothetical protein